MNTNGSLVLEFFFFFFLWGGCVLVGAEVITHSELQVSEFDQQINTFYDQGASLFAKEIIRMNKPRFYHIWT